MLSVNLLLFVLITHAAYLTTCDRCCEINYHGLPRYDLMRNNSRSNQPIISRRVVSNVTECKEFAASKKALAFNFVSARSRAGKQENTCQALQCPEDHNMTTLMPAVNYNYYSMYPVFIPPVNATLKCIPKAGMFLFSSESLNYTQARSFCHKWNASLAHVISEERTEGLGKFVSQNVSSFVGLSSSVKEKIWKNEFSTCNLCVYRFYFYQAHDDFRANFSRIRTL
ncbi:uncharacterized protein LOC105284668 [Ooceraea biroi]|uniref:uncharacterized protein LOC105284668 n=1 Tax=Ooceraea biroi TaxID=2015173 RepID=UPI0005B908DB|nr:uncharacterized protein LOC105284668 [Ooceraea biroi]